jgi:hypothetical protein
MGLRMGLGLFIGSGLLLVCIRGGATSRIGSALVTKYGLDFTLYVQRCQSLSTLAYP